MQLIGEIKSSTQADFITNINALQSGYSLNNEDAGLYFEDDTATPHVLYTNNSINGVEMKRLTWSGQKGGELATVRTFSIVLEAEYLETGGVTTNLEEWSEKMIYVGTGGPRFAVIESEIGPPDYQMVNQKTGGSCIQTGYAVGTEVYQLPNDPLFPAFEQTDRRRVIFTGPTSQRNDLVDFRTEWTYFFEGPGGFSGIMPTAR